MNKLILFLAIALLTSNLTPASNNSAEIEAKRIADIMLEQERTIVTEQIRLTEEETQRFWPIFETYQAESRELLLKIIGLLQRFHAQPVPPSDNWSMAAVDDILEIETKKLAFRKDYANKFGDVLPPEKLLNLMIVGGTIEVGFILKFMSETPLIK